MRKRQEEGDKNARGIKERKEKLVLIIIFKGHVLIVRIILTQS
jgi:hypothetical protein